jgi:hypothetical protein
MSIPLSGDCYADFNPKVKTEPIVNDVEDQQWEDTMEDERFEAQPWEAESC